MNRTVQRAGSQFSLILATDSRSDAGKSFSVGVSASSNSKYAYCSPVVLTISRRRPGRAILGLNGPRIDSASEMFVPPHDVPGPATLKEQPVVERRPFL